MERAALSREPQNEVAGTTFVTRIVFYNFTQGHSFNDLLLADVPENTSLECMFGELGGNLREIPPDFLDDHAPKAMITPLP